MLPLIHTWTAAVSEVAAAELRDFQAEAAQTEVWKVEQQTKVRLQQESQVSDASCDRSMNHDRERVTKCELAVENKSRASPGGGTGAGGSPVGGDDGVGTVGGAKGGDGIRHRDAIQTASHFSSDFCAISAPMQGHSEHHSRGDTNTREPAEHMKNCALSNVETLRRQVAEYKVHAEAAEAEVIDRMKLVADCVAGEEDAKGRALQLEEELREVRSKAGGTIKQLCSRNKELEEEVARLREADELNYSKIGSLKSALDVVQNEHSKSVRGKKNELVRLQEHLAYVRTLVIRYMELESQHEALFPAIATCFKFTEPEVQRIQHAQQQYRREHSLWGRTVSAGSLLVSVARGTAQDKPI